MKKTHSSKILTLSLDTYGKVVDALARGSVDDAIRAMQAAHRGCGTNRLAATLALVRAQMETSK